MFRDDEAAPAKCTCGDCGKTFIKGTEGDNEKFCLRCEELSLLREGDEEYYDDHE